MNHVLPYSQLFGPNVVGTAELIRLAITHRLKPINNVSTVAAAMIPDGGVIDEDADVRTATPVRPLDGSRYADGYANSKWAGEVLLREAHERFGLPVAVFRSDMILAHSKYQGQINVPDMFTRWLFSIVVTGLAPRSFYTSSAAKPHYDGLPVDFTAEAIATLGANCTQRLSHLSRRQSTRRRHFDGHLHRLGDRGRTFDQTHRRLRRLVPPLRDRAARAAREAASAFLAAAAASTASTHARDRGRNGLDRALPGRRA